MKITPELKIFQRVPDLYEQVVADLIVQFPRGGVMVDGGAHIGHHTRPMLERKDVDRVYAIEAIPRLADQVEKRFEGQPRLRVVRCALGREPGRASFGVAVGATGYSGLLKRDLPTVAEWESIEVEVWTLDQIVGFGDAPRVALIKLDLEGGEFDALRGACGVLTRSRPLVIFENGLRDSAKTYGHDWSAFGSFFEAQDYDIFDFFGNRVDQAYWDAVLQTYMFLAVPRASDTADWVQQNLTPIVAAQAASAVA